MSVSYFDRVIRPYAEPEDIRQDGRRLLFRARPIIERWLAAPRGVDQPSAGDPLIMDLPL